MGLIVRFFDNLGKREQITTYVKVVKNQQLRDNQSIGIEGLHD